VLYLVSFIIFSLQATGLWSLPKFGFPGIKILFVSLPWFLILTSISLILVLEIFARFFTLAYRKPILYSTLIIVILVILGGFIMNQTSFHSNLFLRAQEKRLPFGEELYHDFGMPKFHDLYNGVVSKITDNGFQIEDSDKQILNVVINSDTRFPLEEEIKQGDEVIVMGKQDNNTIQASGIQKINNNFKAFPVYTPYFAYSVYLSCDATCRLFLPYLNMIEGADDFIQSFFSDAYAGFPDKQFLIASKRLFCAVCNFYHYRNFR